MAKISMFVFTSLDGYYKNKNNGIDWHDHDDEGNNLSMEGLSSGNILLFGRKTYEMMVSFWPTPMAYEAYPEVAEGMNKAEKIVFSRTLKSSDWQNTRMVSDNLVEYISDLKKSGGKDITILGSGEIISQLADAGLIDQYQLLVDPVAIGAGTSLFSGLKNDLKLKLIESRPFNNGAIFNIYEPLS